MMAISRNTFLPTTNIWDPSQIYEIEGISEPLQELLVRMYQNLNQMSLNINLKDAGYYIQDEFITGQQFYADPADPDQQNFRSTFRMSVDTGQLPAAGSITVAHNIPFAYGQYMATRIYGAATNTNNVSVLPFMIPLPYVSANAVADNLQLDITLTDVVITTGGTNYSDFGLSTVVIEYIKI